LLCERPKRKKTAPEEIAIQRANLKSKGIGFGPHHGEIGTPHGRRGNRKEIPRGKEKIKSVATNQ